MKNVMDYEEFVNEGLLSALKTKSQITKVQGAVFDKACELIEKNPKKYKDGSQVLKEIENDAKELFKKTVKGEDAITPEQWWKEFSPRAARAITVDLK